MNSLTLLNNGGWYFLDNVDFPVTITLLGDEAPFKEEVWPVYGKVVMLTTKQLERVDADFNWKYEPCTEWAFSLGEEVIYCDK